MSSEQFTESGLERLHAAMQRQVDNGSTPGIVTMISRNGESHADALGFLAFDSESPMQRDTIFRIASVSKPITAVAAMILVEECVLRLDDPVDALLPELANRQVLRTLESEVDDTVPANRPITLRDLLTFQAGYGAVMAMPGTYPIQAAMDKAGISPSLNMPPVNADALMAAYGSVPLLHQPGEGWHYNSGSDIAGVLIARATGQSLGEFMQERIFDPLGMKDTGFTVPAGKLDRLPTAYWTNWNTGKVEVFDPAVDSLYSRPAVFESGAGGLVSTADDLHIFGEMMLHNGTLGDTRIISRPSVELMTTDQISPAVKANSFFFPGFWDTRGWGFGVSINVRRDDLCASPGRYGWDGGYGTSWYVDPTENVIGVLLTQQALGSPDGFPKVFSDFWTSTYQAIS